MFWYRKEFKALQLDDANGVLKSVWLTKWTCNLFVKADHMHIFIVHNLLSPYCKPRKTKHTKNELKVPNGEQPAVIRLDYIPFFLFQ